jgi:hypothetical protein
MNKKKDFWYNYNIGSKPKAFKFVEQFTYSCDVNVIDSASLSNIGKLTIHYKLENKQIIPKSIDDFLNLGRTIYFVENTFERDGGYFPYVSSIHLSKEEYINYLRMKKLNRIINN